MYLPPVFLEDDAQVLADGIRAWPLATLIESVDGQLEANPIPLLLTVGADGAGVLQGHAPVQTPVGEDAPEGKAVLVIFHGPSAYISPSWYATKAEHGRVVPTWNYEVIQVRGRMRILRDADWIRSQVTALTLQQEQQQALPWSVDDAPRDYLDGLVTRLKGLEIRIESVVGKTKASQNQPAVNRRGVFAALSHRADPAAQAVGRSLAGSAGARASSAEGMMPSGSGPGDGPGDPNPVTTGA